MAAIKLLVVGSPYEGDRIRQATAAAGGTAYGAEAHDELGPVVASVRPDAIVLAGGGTVRDPLGTVRRLRAAAGAHTPIVFLGDGYETTAVERLVDAAFRRPTDPGALVSRAIALSIGAAPAAPAAPPVDTTSNLRRVAASIDEALNAEMLSALRTVAELPVSPLVASETTPPSTGDLLEGLWSELLAPPSGAPVWIGDDEEDVSAQQPSRAGDLGDVDLPLLLGRAFGEGLTGRLVVERDGVEKVVYFEAGRPVFAASSSPQDRMVEMLTRQGRISEAQRETAVSAAESGRKMGALLIDLGVLGSGELLPAIRRHYEEIVFSLFAWPTGCWRLESGVMASPAQVRLLRHPAALVREGLRHGYPAERLWERLGSRKNVFAMDLRGGASDVATEVVSTPAERRVPLLLDGLRPLEEVVRLSGLPEATVGEIAYTLWSFALLRPAVTTGPSAARFALRDRDIERERILARHALSLEGDYFEVLGVGREASPEEIRRAYDVQCRELAAGALGPELARALVRELEMMRAVLEEALRVLGTATLRARYQASLPPRPGAEASAASPSRPGAF
jgi:DNA-binding response OmpR family regulator